MANYSCIFQFSKHGYEIEINLYFIDRQPWETVTDVERVKINQERLVRNYKISHAKFGTLSLMLMVAYALNVEFYLFKAFTVSIFSSSGGIAPELENRIFLYVTPAAIWIINTIATSLHLRQASRIPNAGFFAHFKHTQGQKRQKTLSQSKKLRM